MSLINDALKNAAKSSPPATPASGAADAKSASGGPMLAVEHPRASGLPRYFVPLFLCALCGAFWFIARGWEARRQVLTGNGPSLPVQAREPGSNGNSEANAGAAAALAPELSDALFPLPDENTPIPERNFALADATSAGARAGATTLSGPRLQAIFYRVGGASAVVDSETVHVGDTVAGGRVKAIDRASVTLERGGETEVLTMRR